MKYLMRTDNYLNKQKIQQEDSFGIFSDDSHEIVIQTCSKYNQSIQPDTNSKTNDHINCKKM